MPSAIAPDETSTTDFPARVNCAMSEAQRATAASSMPRPSLVTMLEPTLTTSRVALAMLRSFTIRGFVRVAGAADRRRLDDERRQFAPRARLRRCLRVLVEPALDREGELAAALAGDRGNREPGTFPAIALHESACARLALVLGNEVELVQYQPSRLRVERWIVFAQFPDDRSCVGHRVGFGVEWRDVDEVQQQPRALEVAQELVPESCAVGRALDQPRDIGDDEAAAFVDPHQTQLRCERRERIVGDLRPRR